MNLWGFTALPAISQESQQEEALTGLNYFSPAMLEVLITSQAEKENVVGNYRPLFLSCKTLYEQWKNPTLWPAIHPEHLEGPVIKNINKDALLRQCLIALNAHLQSLEGISLAYYNPNQENLFERLEKQAEQNSYLMYYRFAAFLVMPKTFKEHFYSMIRIKVIEYQLETTYACKMSWSYEFLEKMWFGEMMLLSHHYFSSDDIMNKKLNLYTRFLTRRDYVTGEKETPWNILYNKLTFFPLIKPFLKNPIIALFYGMCSEKDCVILIDLSQDWNNNCRQIISNLIEEYSALYSSPEDQTKKEGIQLILQEARGKLESSSEKDKFKSYESYERFMVDLAYDLVRYLKIKYLDLQYNPSKIYEASKRQDRGFIFQGILSKYLDNCRNEGYIIGSGGKFLELQTNIWFAHQKEILETALNADIPNVLEICNHICKLSKNEKIRTGH